MQLVEELAQKDTQIKALIEFSQRRGLKERGSRTFKATPLDKFSLNNPEFDCYESSHSSMHINSRPSSTKHKVQEESSSTANHSTKDQMIEKLKDQTSVLTQKLLREEAQCHALERDLARENHRIEKKQNANQKLKEQVRTLQIENDSLRYHQNAISKVHSNNDVANDTSSIDFDYDKQNRGSNFFQEDRVLQMHKSLPNLNTFLDAPISENGSDHRSQDDGRMPSYSKEENEYTYLSNNASDKNNNDFSQQQYSAQPLRRNRQQVNKRP